MGHAQQRALALRPTVAGVVGVTACAGAESCGDAEGRTLLSTPFSTALTAG